jgi:Secretion system C-terminal sorting domain
MLKVLKILIVLAYFICSQHISAQVNKSGNTWMVGPFTSTLSFPDNISSPTFKYRNTTAEPYNLFFVNTASCISDSISGRFLFYSNASTIYDSNGHAMLNGDSLIEGNSNNILSWRQNSVILPKANNQYYVFSVQITDDEIDYADSTGDSVYYAKRLRYSVVDMQGNGGLGAVVKRNVSVTDIGRMRSSAMQAIRHANGKDWWLINLGFGPNRNRHNYVFRTLVTADSVHPQQEQFINTDSVEKFHTGGRITFNKQGTKIAYATGDFGGYIADFNRCNGKLSNVKKIPSIADPSKFLGPGIVALEWSPNGRFLYVIGNLVIFQFDTWSTDSMMNKYIVCYGDTSVGQYTSTYGHIVAGPDDKLYIGNWWAPSKYVHRIFSPDLPGALCNIELRWLKAPVTSFVSAGTTYTAAIVGEMPNIPNFNLPPEPGYDAKCWPLALADLPNYKQLLVYPNPSKTFIDVHLQGGVGNNTFTIVNIHGAIIQRGILLEDEVQRVALNNLASGLYVLRCGGLSRQFLVNE